jgi:xylulokinase
MIQGLNFNRHQQAHLFRAGLEGIAFSFVYGIGIMQEMGLETKSMRVGNDNLFQSAIFADTIATLTGMEIEVIDTTGAVGAAKAAGLVTGAYSRLEYALGDSPRVNAYRPLPAAQPYQDAYQAWKETLERALK